MSSKRDYCFVAVRGLSDLLDFVRGFLLISLIGGAFGSALFGTWGLVEQIYSVLVILSGLGLSQAVVRHLSGPHSPGYIRRTALLSAFVIALLSLALTGLAWLLCPEIASRIIKTEEAMECLLAALPLILINALELFLDGCYRARLRINFHSSARMLMTICTLGAYGYAVYAKCSLPQIITLVLAVKGAYVMVLLSAFLFLECLGKEKQLEIRTEEGLFSLPKDATPKETMKGMLGFGLPLMMFGLSSWLFSTGGKVILGWQDTASAVGRYDASLKIALLVQYLGLPIVYTLLPVLADAVGQKGEKEVGAVCRRFARLYFFLGAPLLFGLLATHNVILEVMTGGQEFSCPEALFLIMALSCFLGQLNAFCHNIVFLKGDSRFLFLANFGSALFCLAINAFITPRCGMWGTALASLLSYALLVFLCAIKTASYGLRPLSLVDLPYALRCLLASLGMYAAILLTGFLPLQGLALLALRTLAGMGAYALITLGMNSFSIKRALSALQEGRLGKN